MSLVRIRPGEPFPSLVALIFVISRQPEPFYPESRPLDMLGISRHPESRKVPQAIVGKWGKNLAVRLPGQIAKAAGLTNGEHVEIQARDGDIVIRRPIPRFNLE